MAVVNTKSYEEMIEILQNYRVGINEQCAVMLHAAQDCIENTQGDDSALKCAKRLRNNVAIIDDEAKSIEVIISAMQDELDALMRSYKQIEFLD